MFIFWRLKFGDGTCEGDLVVYEAIEGVLFCDSELYGDVAESDVCIEDNNFFAEVCEGLSEIDGHPSFPDAPFS